jgi:hypothetical protein
LTSQSDDHRAKRWALGLLLALVVAVVGGSATTYQQFTLHTATAPGEASVAAYEPNVDAMVPARPPAPVIAIPAVLRILGPGLVLPYGATPNPAISFFSAERSHDGTPVASEPSRTYAPSTGDRAPPSR